MSVIPAIKHFIISVEYEPVSGLDWADMWDNAVLGWMVDDSPGNSLQASTPTDPQPVVIGSLPPLAPAAVGAVASPQWVSVYKEGVIMPQLWRGNLPGFFEYLSQNHGANRRLRGNFVSDMIAESWAQWAAQHPEFVWDGVP